MGTFSVDVGAAVNIVDSLRVMESEHPLADLVQRGIDLVSERTDKRKEVYVLSEMSEAIWQEAAFNGVRSRLAADDRAFSVRARCRCRRTE